jgi:hypothetical protein
VEELFEYRRNLVEKLADISQEIRGALADLPAHNLHTPRVKGELSPHQLFSHLRRVESAIFAPRIRRILEEDQPELELFDDESRIGESYNPAEPLEDILRDYERARDLEIALILQMPISAWNRTARHPWFGVRTLQWWVEVCLTYSLERLAWVREESPLR